MTETSPVRHAALGGVQALLWCVSMQLSFVSFSSAPHTITGTSAFYAAMALGALAFVGLGIALDRARCRVSPEVLDARSPSWWQAALIGALLPAFLALLLPRTTPSTVLLFILPLGLPLAIVLTSVDRWSRLMMSRRGMPAEPAARRAGALGILASLAWLALPAGPFVGSALVISRY